VESSKKSEGRRRRVMIDEKSSGIERFGKKWSEGV
jgi:hypothetical protein